MHGISKYTRENKIVEIYNERDESAGSFVAAYESEDGSYIIARSCVIVSLDSATMMLSREKYPFTSFANIVIQDQLWLAAEDRFSPRNALCQFVSWTSTGSLILNLARGSANSLWVCTQDGATHFDPQAPQSRKEYFKGNQISHVFEDREQNIWFTTLNDGIMLVTNRNVKTYNTNDGLSSNRVYSVVKYGEDIFLGHDNFVLTKIDRNDQISKIKFLEYLPSYIRYSKPIVYDVNILPSSMLIITPFALFYHERNDVTIISNLHGRGITQFNDDEYLVAGRYHGLSSFSKKLVAQRKVDYNSSSLIIYREAYTEFDIKQLCNGPVNCIYKQSDSVYWIGLDNGLVRLTRDSVVNVHKPYPTLQDRIVDIKGDSHGNIFIATSNKGVVVLTREGRMGRITEANGLNSNLCNKIAVDGDLLWVGTNAGVNRMLLDRDCNPKQNYIINASSGLPSNYINALLVDQEKIWIGTSNGLTAINKNIDGTESIVPQLYITNVAINGEAIDTLQRSEFTHQQNNLKISFVGLSYKTGDVQYQYSLIKGHHIPDTRSRLWQETQNTSVDFSSLAPGDYSFAVMARSSRDGKWSKPAVYRLVINAPLWETNAFLVGAIIISTVISISVWMFVQKYRKGRKAEMRKLQLAELKSLHSQMNYHFMSNAFNSLQGLFFTGINVDQYIGKFSKLMRITLEHSDRQLISLADELEYLKLYCDIEQLRVGPRFTFLIECHDQINVSKLLVPSLTLQPFIENAIWHGIMPKGDNGVVLLKISPYDSFFKIVIQDDGIGINASLLNKRNTSRRSYGTRLIKDRIETIKQQTNTNISLLIEDLGDQEHVRGTRVSLAFPYTYYE